MWGLDYKESWVPKNWCFWTVVLEKTLESPLDCKEIQLVHPKGDQSWVFIGRTDVEAETPILCPPDRKNWIIGKDPDAGKDWRQEKGTTEDEMVGWHHWLNGHEFEQALGVGDGPRGLVCRRVGHDWVTELILWQISKEHTVWKRQSSKWCWKSVPSCAKEWNWTTILHHIQNLNGLNVWPEIKLLEGNIGSKVLNIGCGSHILDLTIKDKEVGVQTEKLLHSKRNHQQMKR